MRLKGEKVFDLPSRTLTTIVEVRQQRAVGTLYKVGDNVPLNPTGDGAFPDRWRKPSEVVKPSIAKRALRTWGY